MERRRKTTCFSRRARQNGPGSKAASSAMIRPYGKSRDQRTERRQWLVRVLAQRAVDIVTSQESEA